MQTAIGASKALKDVFRETGVKVQTHLFKIDGSSFTTVERGHSMRLDFSPFSFYHQNGRPAVGNIDLELEEAFSKAEILTSGFSCFCEGQCLELFGQVKISAFKAGEPLLLGKKALVHFPIPDDFRYEHEIFAFRGQPSKIRMPQGGGALDWEQIASGKGKILKKTKGYFFEFTIDSLGWLAVGTYPFYGISKVMMSAKHQPMASPLVEAAAFLVLNNNKTVVRMFPGNNYFSAYNIPENVGAKIIIFATDRSNLYLGVRSVPNVCKSVYYVPIEMVSMVTVKHFLQHSLQ